MIYRFLFEAALKRIPAEAAHSLAARAFGLVTLLPGVGPALRRALRPEPSLEIEALGQRFPSPLGVAGGMDKDATWFEALGALGFGFVEVGAVTAQRQHGNDGKRVWRLTEDRAVLNRPPTIVGPLRLRPLWPSRISRALAQRLRDSGYSSLQEAVTAVTSSSAALVRE